MIWWCGKDINEVRLTSFPVKFVIFRGENKGITRKTEITLEISEITMEITILGSGRIGKGRVWLVWDRLARAIYTRMIELCPNVAFINMSGIDITTQTTPRDIFGLGNHYQQPSICWGHNNIRC